MAAIDRNVSATAALPAKRGTISRLVRSALRCLGELADSVQLGSASPLSSGTLSDAAKRDLLHGHR